MLVSGADQEHRRRSYPMPVLSAAAPKKKARLAPGFFSFNVSNRSY
jgi:hypothetical protein